MDWVIDEWNGKNVIYVKHDFHHSPSSHHSHYSHWLPVLLSYQSPNIRQHFRELGVQREDFFHDSLRGCDAEVVTYGIDPVNLRSNIRKNNRMDWLLPGRSFSFY